jgi:phosphate transport system substrate-binding protein
MMMNKVIKNSIGILFLSLIFFFSCKKKNQDEETILTGNATVFVDESIFPIVEDQKAVFETQYEGRLKLNAISETQIVNKLVDGSATLAVLPRKLTSEEIKYFKAKKIFPKQTLFAKDAVAFIRNKKENDTLISLEDVYHFIQGKKVTAIKGLVFDNPNSSTVQLISQKSQLKVAAKENIYSLNNNKEVIDYVATHVGFVGVVGINWIFQPTLEMQTNVDKVSVLSVKDKNTSAYIYPSQDNLAQGKYPLARDLFIVNCQGYSGLGMGFASFVAGERGQRIVLKSGLAPQKVPSRKIMIRKKITK